MRTGSTRMTLPYMRVEEDSRSLTLCICEVIHTLKQRVVHIWLNIITVLYLHWNAKKSSFSQGAAYVLGVAGNLEKSLDFLDKYWLSFVLQKLCLSGKVT